MVKEIKRIKGSKIEKELNSIISQHDHLKNCYFWSSPSSASARRCYEKQYSRLPLVFKYNGKVYEITQTVECSCKNIYYKLSVYVDSDKKNITILKNLVK